MLNQGGCQKKDSTGQFVGNRGVEITGPEEGTAEEVGERLSTPSGWPFHPSRDCPPGGTSRFPLPPGASVAYDIQPDRNQQHGGCREGQDSLGDLADVSVQVHCFHFISRIYPSASRIET